MGYKDDALEIVMPEPDSHFRLLPCKKCHGDNVAYVKYLHPEKGELWRVVCFDCGEIVDTADATCRHEIQIIWNGRT
jgi:hypothetical protein